MRGYIFSPFHQLSIRHSQEVRPSHQDRVLPIEKAHHCPHRDSQITWLEKEHSMVFGRSLIPQVLSLLAVISQLTTLLHHLSIALPITLDIQFVQSHQRKAKRFTLVLCLAWANISPSVPFPCLPNHLHTVGRHLVAREVLRTFCLRTRASLPQIFHH